mmetsp:Transcript_14838/g.40593  ORF Transcript_14838/g.40593 Transcript_14838/m.40593 type:complete len:217 (-) Transcript_14838:27-677(-)
MAEVHGNSSMVLRRSTTLRSLAVRRRCTSAFLVPPGKPPRMKPENIVSIAGAASRPNMPTLSFTPPHSPHRKVHIVLAASGTCIKALGRGMSPTQYASSLTHMRNSYLLPVAASRSSVAFHIFSRRNHMFNTRFPVEVLCGGNSRSWPGFSGMCSSSCGRWGISAHKTQAPVGRTRSRKYRCSPRRLKRAMAGSSRAIRRVGNQLPVPLASKIKER